MHDNDSKHTSKRVRNWLDKQEFQTLVWPSQSPDLNPIENLWFHVKRQLYSFPEPPKGLNELWERFQSVWNELKPEFLPERMLAVIEARGKWTSY